VQSLVRLDVVHQPTIASHMVYDGLINAQVAHLRQQSLDGMKCQRRRLPLSADVGVAIEKTQLCHRLYLWARKKGKGKNRREEGDFTG
jgi:hypothetical protein